ncbi:hypothetical protein B0H15DRAFT_376251 [Mycena belliarum]|uniref:Uncharacterized protein n=1 Tax=Mycena belliarum TaxID=1033014 RepID=A0AAD6XMS4_9AGAR|nr:hypothetical protein B0H15DRAFT_376251 [Mycena belliae]
MWLPVKRAHHLHRQASQGYRVPRWPKDLFGEEGVEIDDKKGSYMTMTAFQWFPALVEDPFPDVSGVLLPYKNALCNEVSAIIQSLPTKSTLESHHQTTIQRQIFVLLCASAGANILQARIGITAYEAESRHDWDALLYCFYIADEEIVSRNILLERTIHLPQNQLAEVEDSNRLAEIVKDVTQSSPRFCLNAQINAAKTSEFGSELSIQAAQATLQAHTTAFSYKSLCDHQQKLQQLIQRRSRREPKDGKCDAMCFFAVSAPSSIEAADVAALDLFKYTKEEPATKQKDTKTGESDSSSGRGAGDAKGKTATNEVKPTKKGESSGTGASKAVPTLNDATRKYRLQNPFNLSQDLSLAAVDAVPEFKVPEPDAAWLEDKLLFPHLVVEYKKQHHTAGKALNQGRMYLISVISFYAALNIVDRAFYALVTNGAKGALLMGWKSKRGEKTYLFERSVVQFDISTPVGAYHFAIFLLRLREEQRELEVLIEAELKKGKFDRDQFMKWRKESQTVHEDPGSESTKTSLNKMPTLVTVSEEGEGSE